MHIYQAHRPAAVGPVPSVHDRLPLATIPSSPTPLSGSRTRGKKPRTRPPRRFNFKAASHPHSPRAQPPVSKPHAALSALSSYPTYSIPIPTEPSVRRPTFAPSQASDRLVPHSRYANTLSGAVTMFYIARHSTVGHARADSHLIPDAAFAIPEAHTNAVNLYIGAGPGADAGLVTQRKPGAMRCVF